jgi:hypothetical protein
MGARGSRAVVLDSGALIAFERNEKAVRQLVRLALEEGSAIMCRRQLSPRLGATVGVKFAWLDS